MENLKNEKKSNTKTIIIIAVAIILVAAISVLAFTMLKGKTDNKKELETSLKEMGKSFYENFYYEQVGASAEERTSSLAKFSTVGINVDLENLTRYNNGEFKDKISKFVNKKTEEKCNKTNTKVYIYPKSPYGKTDYTIKAELDCGFEENNK